MLHDKETIRELREFMFEHTASGNRAFHAPEGRFDDRVIALAIACEVNRQFVPMRPKARRSMKELMDHYDIHVDDEEDTGGTQPGWGES